MKHIIASSKVGHKALSSGQFNGIFISFLIWQSSMWMVNSLIYFKAGNLIIETTRLDSQSRCSQCVFYMFYDESFKYRRKV